MLNLIINKKKIVFYKTRLIDKKILTLIIIKLNKFLRSFVIIGFK